MASFNLQSAMEYLMTYGWAILILAVAAAVLFSLGVFSPGSAASQICQLEEGFSCQSYYLVQNGILVLNLAQATTVPINVTAIGCNTNSTNIPTTAIAPQVYLPIGANNTVSIQCYQGSTAFSGRVNQLYVGYLVINYTDLTTGFPNVVYGNIAVRIAK